MTKEKRKTLRQIAWFNLFIGIYNLYLFSVGGDWIYNFLIGSHSMNHQNLNRIVNKEKILYEILESKSIIEKKIGIIIHDYFQKLHSNHSPLAILLIFLNQNKNKYNYIIKISNSEIKKKLVRLYFPKDIIVKSYLENLFKYLAIIPVISVKFFFSLIKKVYVSKKLALNKIYNQKVIFFPPKAFLSEITTV